MLQTLAIGMPGPFEMVIIAGLGLLIFGKRVPDVARNLALGIKSFQQGLKSAGDEISGGGDDDDGNDGRKRLPDDKR